MGKLQETTLCLLQKTAITTFVTLNAETTVYTVPTGRTCILSHGWLKVAGDVGPNLVVTVGQNGDEDDWVGLTAASNLDADLDVIIISPVPSATPATLVEYVAGELIKFKVTTAGNAVAGTFYLFGFLDDA